MYNDPNCKAWNSGRWAPPGFKSRQDLIEQSRAAEAHKPLAGETTEHFEKAAVGHEDITNTGGEKSAV